MEGDAFLISHRKDSPGLFRAETNCSPCPGPASWHRAFSSSRLILAWSAATRVRAWAAMVCKMFSAMAYS